MDKTKTALNSSTSKSSLKPEQGKQAKDEQDDGAYITIAASRNQNNDDMWDNVFFYLTICFSLVAIGSFFIFLFLVPFIIEPSIVTLQMDFPVDPVTCCVVSFWNTSGAENCSDWSSCREGCTRDVFSCVQIRVAYTDTHNFSCQRRPPNHQWLYDNAMLFPNVKGCGYPPYLNCTLFASTYGRLNTTFPCFYSRIDPTMVITTMKPSSLHNRLIFSIGIPFFCFIVAIGYLVFAYRRVQTKRRKIIDANKTKGKTSDDGTSGASSGSSFSRNSMPGALRAAFLRVTTTRSHSDPVTLELYKMEQRQQQQQQQQTTRPRSSSVNGAMLYLARATVQSSILPLASVENQRCHGNQQRRCLANQRAALPGQCDDATNNQPITSVRSVSSPLDLVNASTVTSSM